jgi:hypothetical protein
VYLVPSGARMERDVVVARVPASAIAKRDPSLLAAAPHSQQQPLGALTNMHPAAMLHASNAGMGFFPHMSPYMHPGMHLMAAAAASGPPKPMMAHSQPPLSHMPPSMTKSTTTNAKENTSATIATRTPGSAAFAMAQPTGIVSSMSGGAHDASRQAAAGPNFFSFSPAELEQKERQQRGELLGVGADDPMNNGMSPFFGMSATPASTMKTPFHSDTDFSSNYFSSGKKNGAFFDSPKRHSPAYPDMRGMTPLSHLKDTFSNTPFTGESMKLSPAMYNDELNKTLFGGDEHALSDIKKRFIMKTPKARSPKQISFRIGSDLSSKSDGGGGVEAQLSHVSISPIANYSGSSKTRSISKKDPVAVSATAEDLPQSAKSLAQVSLASGDKARSKPMSALKRKSPVPIRK